MAMDIMHGKIDLNTPANMAKLLELLGESHYKVFGNKF